MPSYFCIDPHDQYAQAEVLVEFTLEAEKVTLISAFDLSGRNILSELDIVQQQIIRREIALDYRRPLPTHDARLHQGPSWASKEENGYGRAK